MVFNIHMAHGSYRPYGSWLLLSADVQDSDLMDGRQHCCVVQAGDGESHYLSVQSRQDLLTLEKTWYRGTLLAVKHLGVSKTSLCRIGLNE